MSPNSQKPAQHQGDQVYIEESGADLTVTVQDEEYHTEASVDLDSDGVDDTAVVETDDGAIAFTDTDADGQADLMTQLDADGGVISQARFDEATGEWVQVDPLEPMTVDAPRGDVQVSDPTHDTDGDGVSDSIVTTDSDGDTLIYTDADEDGDADYATEITGDGRITVSEHGVDGDWTVIERGHLDEHGVYHRDTDQVEAAEESGWISSGRSDAAEVRVDPRTGEWTRGG